MIIFVILIAIFINNCNGMNITIEIFDQKKNKILGENFVKKNIDKIVVFDNNNKKIPINRDGTIKSNCKKFTIKFKYEIKDLSNIFAECKNIKTIIDNDGEK